MTDYTFFEDLGSEVQSPQRGILSQTLVKHDAFEFVQFALAAGEQLSEHTAARTAIVHILSGTGELTVAGDKHVLRRDGWLLMKPRTPHSIVADTPLTFCLYLLTD